MSSDILEKAKIEYQAGKVDFERGQYRSSVQHLEKARALVDRNSVLGGEVLIWLVTAYEAAGQRTEALALCRLLNNHPQLETRQQSKRLLYILEAPKLQSRPEWLTQIPDLNSLDEAAAGAKQFTNSNSSKSRTKAASSEENPVDLSQVNTQDNRFIWLALMGGILTLAGLFYFSQV